jgi:hypothetical protein
MLGPEYLFVARFFLLVVQVKQKVLYEDCEAEPNWTEPPYCIQGGAPYTSYQYE